LFAISFHSQNIVLVIHTDHVIIFHSRLIIKNKDKGGNKKLEKQINAENINYL